MEIWNRSVSWATCLSISCVKYSMVILKFKGLYVVRESSRHSFATAHRHIVKLWTGILWPYISLMMSYTICFRRKFFLHTEQYYFNYVKGKSLYLSEKKRSLYRAFSTLRPFGLLYSYPLTSSHIHLQRRHATYRCARPLPAKVGTITNEFC